MLGLETKRLVLRRFSTSDGADLFEYLSDPRTVRYEPYDPFTFEAAEAEAARRADDPAFWAVCLRDTAKLIGNIYFSKQGPDMFDTWEIGYVFNRSYGGCGYATEAARRVLKHGFDDCGAHRIEAHCNPENTPSWKLLERLNMRREGHFLQKVFFKRDDNGNPMWHDAYAYGMLDVEWRRFAAE
ncbi:MAG: GNAT family N-acetyltransferase [Oscillospiraceae bacterium]|jgi:RimJ/RimL family protein N-acetyltransferase|nr:GNAT family N-acetyltransferase [Oscillospiraceae bacterium]